MRITDYIKDKGLFVAINLLVFVIVSSFIYSTDGALVIIFLLFCVWFLPLFTYIIIEYIKFRRYFTTVENTLENLDKKYLLPEVIKESNFIEGEEINYILKELSRDMHEDVNYYKNMQEEYR